MIFCRMIRRVLPALVLATALAAPATAQQETVTMPEAPELATVPPRTMIGNWEFSNADREKICTLTFRNDAAMTGKRLEFDPGCAKLFPFVTTIVAWRFEDNDFLRLLDAADNSVLEFSEVESGIFEAPKPGEGILFIQNPSDLGPAPKTAAELSGEWTLMRRTGQRVCGFMLSPRTAGEDFVLRLHPPCEAMVTRFGPATWQVDRGELVLRSASGQSWRFEEQDGAKWHRVPETAVPLLMVRK
jgi:hypothetical protein